MKNGDTVSELKDIIATMSSCKKPNQILKLGNKKMNDEEQELGGFPKKKGENYLQVDF